MNDIVIGMYKALMIGTEIYAVVTIFVLVVILVPLLLSLREKGSKG